jgi:zinc protease
MMIVKNTLFAFFLTLSTVNLFASEPPPPTACKAPSPSPIVQERSLPALGATELTLANGVRVCLKPTTFDEDEILIQAFAPGGFTTLSPAKRASAELAPAIAWESGIGGITAQQWSRTLLGLDIDLATHVGPYDHSIEGVAPPEKLADLMRMLGSVFTAPQFSQSAVTKVSERMRESVKHQADDVEQRFEYAAKAINSSDLPALRLLTESEIMGIDFAAAESFYRNEFLNPKALTFVVVGDFTIEEIKPLVVEHLAGIPSVKADTRSAPILECPFPKEVRHGYVKGKEARDSLTCITFCIEGATKAEDLRLWETMTQVLETRLRRAFLDEVGSTHGIDVALELPLHPLCTPIWLTLQFRCNPDKINRLVEVALREIREMQRQGPTAEDLKTAIELQSCNDLFWEGENSYWLALLSNHYRQVLRLETLGQDSAAPTLESVTTLLRTALDLSRYTVVTLGR